jgi:hypothetical protein
VLTKAIIQSIDYTKNMCRVRIPLFENASRNVNAVEADAQFSVVPGIYNSYKTGDIVFIGFEENAMENPVILGKLFVSATAEANSYRGNLSGNSLAITDTAQLPYSTVFNYEKISQNNALYNNLNTPKKLADSILDLQRSQVQRYQTIIEITTQENIVYSLYLKTTNDFTYSPDKSDEPLYRLCAALQRSQVNNAVIPLELALEFEEAETDQTVNYITHQALLYVQEFNSNTIKLEAIIDGNKYEVSKYKLRKVRSIAIQY